MSELVKVVAVNNSLHQKLLTTASSLALIAYAASAPIARAEESDRPTVWIELGGQLEAMQGISRPFSAPFMSPETAPDVYGAQTFAWKQKAPRLAFGGEGKVEFRPTNSDWSLSAAIRFGRSNSKKHTHYQGPQISYTFANGFKLPRYAAAFSDTLVEHRETHAVVDFTAGRDLGIGVLGREGVSTVNVGVRFAQFSIKSNAQITARPNADLVGISLYQYPTFHQYALAGRATRSFRGVGPSLSWNSSTALSGNAEDGELALDWGINGAVLFGRQKANVSHSTNASHFLGSHFTGSRYVAVYPARAANTSRSRSVTVPNLGGFAGITMRKANAKVSLGYRADFFFGATDTGIDARRTSDLDFHGPFATIGIGLGG